MRARRSRRYVVTAVVAITAIIAAGCSNSSTGEGGQAVAGNAVGSGASALKGVCPDTVVIQTDWWPQAEYGGIYRLVGAKPTIDGNKGSVTGTLVDNGTDTGVKIQIRSGGPANNFTPSASLLYTDDSILMGSADLDAVAQFSGSGKPVQAVFAPLDLSPVVLMWDPKQHPNFNTIADIGQTSTKVVYFQGSAYMAYLLGAGLLRPSQVSATYAGTPDQWSASKGSIVQQGFVTNEVLRYPQDKSIWGKPVSYQLVTDSGYPVYPETMAIRPDKKAQNSACLKKLVPVLQRSTAAYAASPAATDKFISELVSKFPKAFPYSTAQGDAAVKAMKENQVLGNGRNKTVGDFDTERVQRILTIVTPIFAAQKTPVKAGITPDQLATNEFIDPSIGVK
jgi:ABC-type nitrate/sulfonate/bicarbonate transport system substrate-binding protein